jgi:hypothetical protein
LIANVIDIEEHAKVSLLGAFQQTGPKLIEVLLLRNTEEVFPRTPRVWFREKAAERGISHTRVLCPASERQGHNLCKDCPALYAQNGKEKIKIEKFRVSLSGERISFSSSQRG